MRSRTAWGLVGTLGAIAMGWSVFSRPGVLTGPHLTRYLVPAGRVGWVQVQYGVPKAPPLPTEDGGALVQVPANAVVQTSDKQLFKWLEFYYVSRTRRQRLKSSGMTGDGSMIWGVQTYKPGIGFPDTRKIPYATALIFFVGTEALFKKTGMLQPPE
jgi:hypothetical protein